MLSTPLVESTDSESKGSLCQWLFPKHRKPESWAGAMVQWVKALDAEPDKLSSIPGNNTVEKGNQLP